MHFNSLSELIHMNGHGPYVWGAILFSTFLLTGLFFFAVRQYKLQYKINQQLNTLPKDN